MAARPPLWISGAFWLLSAFTAYGQHWSFQHYGPESGLANPTILALTQDRQGYLWVSTEGGLFRYDGDRFQPFDANRPGHAALITSLHTSADGQLWAGSMAGLFRWSGERFLAVPGSGDLELEGAQAIGSDERQLYVASNSGLWSYPLAGDGHLRQLSPGAIASVFAGRNGSVWFGCDSSLCRLRNGEYNGRKVGNGLPAGPWTSITEDTSGALWVRSEESLWTRDGEGGGPFHHVANLGSSHRVALVPGSHGEVITPHSGGVAICTSKGCQNYGVESGLQGTEVLAAYEDREGSLWIGYSGHGLARWLGRDEWQNFSEPEGLTDTSVWRIVHDRSGDLWVATNQGLFHGIKQGFRWHFRRSEVLHTWTVYGLIPDPDGSLWMGTFQAGLKGLVHYDPRTGRKTVYPPADPKTLFSVNGLSRDESGAIWVAAKKDVLRWSPGARTLETLDLPISGASIYSIVHGGGAMYISGRKGLYVERGSMHRLLTTKDGLKDEAVQSVTLGPAGEVWIEYYSALGLSRLDWGEGGSFRIRHFTMADGLTSDSVYSQAFDAKGRHWIGTDGGAAVLDGDGWIRHDTSEGLVWNDCNAMALQADADGVVWIGTSFGLSRFLASPRKTAPVPSTLITAVTRDDAAGAQGRWDGNGRTIALRFTMLSYLQQDPLFRYRLGTTRPWIETRARELHVAELPPGSYHFEVQGDLGRGRWSSPATREFVIKPPWFRSWSFLTTAASMMTGLIWFGWRRRERSQQRLREHLEAAVEERTRGLAAAMARAEQESRFKGEFLANMSHEMRTPLNGVLGLTKLALELSDQPEVVDHLTTVQFSAKVLLSLINDVLDLAKIEAGMLEIVPVSFAPGQLFNEVQLTMEPEAQRKGLRLELSVEGDVPGWVKADDSRLRQVLVNLIGNAIKFTQEGGVKIAIGHDGAQLRCAVTDTGIGVAPEKQALIFDQFRQADGSISRSHGGTGLGLAISLKLVESMGGTISLESEVGRGSTFQFAIDAPPAAAQVRDQPLELNAPGRPLRILVAEDNKVNQILLLALLRKRGHHAVVANNGSEALEACARESFDLVLMDIQMPEMDGIEAVRRLRKAEALNGLRTPVIAVTARAMMGDRAEILAAGMDDYLEKPIRTEQLDAVLSRFARSSRPTKNGKDDAERAVELASV